MTEIMTVIKEIGFPIAAFLLMFWFANNTMTKNTEAIKLLTTEIENMRVMICTLKLTRNGKSNGKR